MALEDAQRTMGLVRSRAPEWHIDPHNIGVLGFSAGGHLVAAISNHFDRRLYPAVDAADNKSCRPDFAVAVYPGHLSLSAAEWHADRGTKKFVIPHPPPQSISDANLALNPGLRLTSRTCGQLAARRFWADYFRDHDASSCRSISSPRFPTTTAPTCWNVRSQLPQVRVLI